MAAHEIATANLKSREDNLERMQRLVNVRQTDAAESLINAATEAASSLKDSVQILSNAQNNVLQSSADTVRKIAEVRPIFTCRSVTVSTYKK